MVVSPNVYFKLVVWSSGSSFVFFVDVLKMSEKSKTYTLRKKQKNNMEPEIQHLGKEILFLETIIFRLQVKVSHIILVWYSIFTYFWHHLA